MKYYEIRVTLNDLKKRIYRKIRIRADITINKFCEIVILSMNGDLTHLYQLNCNNCTYMPDCYGEYSYEDDVVYMKNKKISSLKLQKGDKFSLDYDFGDDWQFNITVSKVVEDTNFNKPFEVINGKGLGIIEDCGGIWKLMEYANGTLDEEESEMKEFMETFDLDEFDLEKCNQMLEAMLNII